MNDIRAAGAFPLGDRVVKRMGYGAMQLAGPGVFGPPKDHDTAIAVLREAVASGVNHLDTSDYYGPYVTNQLIREALHPYPDDLVIVTKIGARRGPDASWNPAMSPDDLKSAVHDNLRNLGLDAMEVVNLRIMGAVHGPAEGPIEAPLTVLADLQRQGLVRHIGLSNVTSDQIKQGRRICDIVCVQNMYNVAHREDDSLIDDLARAGIAYVPFFPLGGFTPLQSTALNDVAARLGATPDAGRARLAPQAGAQHPAHPRHLVARALTRKPGRGEPHVARRHADRAGQDRIGKDARSSERAMGPCARVRLKRTWVVAAVPFSPREKEARSAG